MPRRKTITRRLEDLESAHPTQRFEVWQSRNDALTLYESTDGEVRTLEELHARQRPDVHIVLVDYVQEGVRYD